MATLKTEIRSGVYYDSAKLMSLQRSLAELPGVLDAGVVMGTDSNKELLAHIGLDSPEVKAAKPDDLAIVVKAENAKAAWKDCWLPVKLQATRLISRAALKAPLMRCRVQNG